MPAVVDASVLTKLVIDEGASSDAARAWFASALEAGTTLLAPELLRYELTSCVQRLRGDLDLERRVDAVQHLLGPFRLEAPDHLVWMGLAPETLSIYDAAYVALASTTGSSLVTADGPMAAEADRRQIPCTTISEEPLGG